MDQYGQFFQNIAKIWTILTHFPKYRKKWIDFYAFSKILQKNDKFGHIFQKNQKKDKLGNIFQNYAKSGSIWTHSPQYCKKWIILDISSNAIRDKCQHCSPWVEFVSHPLSFSQNFAKEINNHIVKAVQLFFSSAPGKKINFLVVELLLNGSKYDL